MKLKAKNVLALLFIMAIAISNVSAQKTIEKIEKVEIKTSAVCGMCKARLEKNIAFEKGVKSVVLDNETKVLTVEYTSGKTDKEKLKKAVTKIGYDADEMPANKKAHDRLPSCCQKGNVPH